MGFLFLLTTPPEGTQEPQLAPHSSAHAPLHSARQESYYKVYSLHLPERVQRRCWKMSVLYGIVQKSVQFASPREAPEEVLENVAFIWHRIIKCTVCISQRGSREGAGKCRFYMASYYKEYSLHLPRRVQSRCWKMSALYGIVL